MHQSFGPPTLGETRDNHLICTTCVSLGGGVNTHFHFFVVWFSDGSKSSGGEWADDFKLSETQANFFTFNLSMVTFLCHLVIWTFDINYLRSLCSHFLLLKMLFKVWWEDLRKVVTTDSTQGTLVCTAEYQGAGTSLGIFAPVSRNFTGFHTHTEWKGGWGFQMTGA